jgi:hypothetical protein
MRLVKSLLCIATAAALSSGAAFAANEDYGVSSSAIPSSPSEARGMEENPAEWWRTDEGANERTRAVFDAYDANGDGSISREEASINPYFTGVFSETDLDKSGEISRGELTYAMNQEARGEPLSQSPSEIGLEEENVVYYVIPEPQPVEVWVIEPAS